METIGSKILGYGMVGAWAALMLGMLVSVGCNEAGSAAPSGRPILIEHKLGDSFRREWRVDKYTFESGRLVFHHGNEKITLADSYQITEPDSKAK